MRSADYQRLLNHVLNDGEFLPLINSPTMAAHRAEWRALIAEHAKRPPASSSEAENFHNHWHVCHHYLRKLVADETAVLNMLWVWLPRYKGSDLVLYRGENWDRLEAGQLGIAWTDAIETARIFAKGLNATGKGGALVRAEAPASAIIAGPSTHSVYLGESEFTVDPRNLIATEVLERFPARD